MRESNYPQLPIVHNQHDFFEMQIVSDLESAVTFWSKSTLIYEGDKIPRVISAFFLCTLNRVINVWLV